MRKTLSEKERQRVYRIDKFKVPRAARKEFLDKVQETHQFMRTLPGFVEDSILEQSGGPGTFNIITIAVWENAGVVEAAKKIVQGRQEAQGFRPQEFLAKLGIESDIATYSRLEI